MIDMEYAGWNPMAFDLASYFAETMFENDCKASETGTACRLDNMMTFSETTEFAKVYLITYFDNYLPPDLKAAYTNIDDYLAKNL